MWKLNVMEIEETFSATSQESWWCLFSLKTLLLHDRISEERISEKRSYFSSMERANKNHEELNLILNITINGIQN